MVGCELVLALVMGKPESFGAGHRGVGEPAGKQIGESEAFQRHGQQTDGAGPAADVDGAGMKRENRAVIPKTKTGKLVYTGRTKVSELVRQAALDVGSINDKDAMARSAIHGMKTMGMTVTVAGPPTLIPPACQELGVKVSHRLDEAIAHADVVMMLRLQHERMQACLIPSVREYSRVWGLGLDKLEHCRPDVLIMHPGPVNRGVELAPEVADGPYSVILDQVANGVAVRMAVLYLLAGSRAA